MEKFYTLTNATIFPKSFTIRKMHFLNTLPYLNSQLMGAGLAKKCKECIDKLNNIEEYKSRWTSETC